MSAEVITLTGMCGVACRELTLPPHRESARFHLPITPLYRNFYAKIDMSQRPDDERPQVREVNAGPSRVANCSLGCHETMLSNSRKSGVKYCAKARNRMSNDVRAAIAGRRLPFLR